jgi:hypothetical protein
LLGLHACSEVVLVAVKKDWRAIQYADPELLWEAVPVVVSALNQVMSLNSLFLNVKHTLAQTFRDLYFLCVKGFCLTLLGRW